MPTNSPIISNEKIVEAVPRANRVGRVRWVIEAYTGLMIIERENYPRNSSDGNLELPGGSRPARPVGDVFEHHLYR